MNKETLYDLLSSIKNTIAISIGSDECYQEFACFEICNSFVPLIGVLKKYQTAKYISVGREFLHIFDDEKELIGSEKIQDCVTPV